MTTSRRLDPTVVAATVVTATNVTPSNDNESDNVTNGKNGSNKARMITFNKPFQISVVLILLCVLGMKISHDATTIVSKAYAVTRQEIDTAKKHDNIHKTTQDVKEKEVDGILYDLDEFLPINGASTTFTIENYRFIPLLQQQNQNEGAGRLLLSSRKEKKVWTIPDIDDPTNHLSTSALHSLTNNTTTTINTTNICQIFCRFPTRSFGYTHFPHFLQQALPCWNIFHYFASGTNSNNDYNTNDDTHSPIQQYFYYMILPEQILPTKLSSYIQSFIKVLESSRYHIQIIYGFNESLPIHDDCDRTTSKFITTTSTNSSSTTSMSILAIKSFSDTGWDRPCKYFLSTNTNKQSYFYAIQQLQQAVLLEQYVAGPSTFRYDNTKNGRYSVIQVLILDRKKSTRDFVYSNNMIKALQNFVYINPDNDMYLINVTYISSFSDRTLYDQALSIYSADIIYSPHGAQLSNLVYIRPCTVVVEMFPPEYYLQFFQSLVVNAYGISYEGYPKTNGTKVMDTQKMLQEDRRSQVRSNPIYVTSEFFIQTLPQLMNASLQCRLNYYETMPD
jgi:Glycosyltransferase 61